MEGARWVKAGLDDPESKKLFAPLPILHVTAVPKKKTHDQEKASTTYNCPVYKYPRRNDKYLIFRVFLNCGDSSHSGP